MDILFWLSIGLWVTSLLSYALILTGKEQLERKDSRMSVFMPFEVLFHDSEYSRYSRYLRRTAILSALGAMLSGAMFLLTVSF